MKNRTMLGFCLLSLPLLACSGGTELESPLPDDTGASTEPAALPPSSSADDTSVEGVPTVANADEDHPCGDNTVAVVSHQSGVKVVFCVLDDRGVVAVGEHRQDGTPSLLKRAGYDAETMCPADLLRAIAPEQRVPARLEASCDPARRQARLPSAPERLRAPDPASFALAAEAVYCEGENPRWEFTDRCRYYSRWADDVRAEDGSALVKSWCKFTEEKSHSNIMSGSGNGLGDEGNIGEETVASCIDYTIFQAFWRWDAGDPWTSSIFVPLGPGGVYTWNISYTGGLEDIDVRFTAQSQNAGIHRYAGIFIDE
ncbi:hypothetical protein [Sorangium sp. So ce693]|uniref:hypothetical protein n=1 Tax=Sorangium sp. So ce693 TaxID=3133318 RepID=UPI003F6036A0